MSRSARPRIRSLKPEVWQDERFAGLGNLPVRLYVGLITQADDEGRGSANLNLIRARIFPFDERPLEDFALGLQALRDARLVELYDAGGRSLIQITSWADDQRVDKPTASDLPAPPRPAGGSAREQSGVVATTPEPGGDPREESGAFPPSRAPADRTGPDPDQDQERTAPEGAGARTEDITTVFEAWVAATERDPSRTKLDPDRRRLIDKRLRSHGLDDCLAAVRNIGASIGENSARDGYGRGHRFDDLKHALGKTEQIERWREAPTTKGAGTKGVASSRDLAYLDDGVLPADYDEQATRSQAA